MDPTDRAVRARVYELFVAGARDVDAARIGIEGASQSLQRLHDEHRLLVEEGKVVMAHPFSGVDTGHYATIGERTYWANCAWDALAILALLGDGVATCPGDLAWTVRGGVVDGEGLIHLLVPARHFWDDVAYT